MFFLFQFNSISRKMVMVPTLIFSTLSISSIICQYSERLFGKTSEMIKGCILPKDTVVFAKIGEAIKLNRRAFVTRAGLADNNVMAVIPETLISKRFIYHFMHTVDLTDASRSTTVPSIRKGDIETLPLNIPSQAEQKEIADRLDTLLAQVEATQAHLAKVTVHRDGVDSTNSSGNG